MPVVTEPEETRELLDRVRQAGAALACFCTENSWTTEAILRATTVAARRLGVDKPPVCVGFTASYQARSQLGNYWVGGDWRVGLKGVLDDMRVLAAPDGPYGECRVLPQLDHGQPVADREILERWADELAIVMFDASSLPLDENIELTADYAARFGDRVVIEGAVDELKEASAAGEAFELTTPAQARRFLERTGCDLIVPNVGTEHRAARAGTARYHGERAREIARAVGPRLVLHGSSSLPIEEAETLPSDGFVKVNLWTLIERKGAESIADYLLENAGDILSRSKTEELVKAGLLGGKVLAERRSAGGSGREIGPKLTHFPLYEFRRRWVEKAVQTLAPYFDAFGYARLAGR